MGRNKSIMKQYEEEQITRIIDEIDATCDDLRMRGLDLNKITFTDKKSYSKYQRDWMMEFDTIRNRILRSGEDLSKILITESGAARSK